MREYAVEHNMEYLLEEWDEEKNKLTVDDVAAGNRNRYHWKKHYYDEEKDKEFDFEWTSAPDKRCHAKSMCPYLSNKAVWHGYNDLATINPLLAKEWHPTKNGDLKPENASPNSSKKIWWICPDCGNEYQATPAHRNLEHTGCPKCAKEVQTSFPEYAIMYYLQKYVKNIEHSYKELGFELDIYLPDLNIAIEYDGKPWHQDKIDKDIEKNKKCKELGIKLYRLRAELDSLNDYSVDILCTKKSESLNKSIEILLKEILNVDEKINTEKDRFEIEKNRRFKRKKNSLATICPDLAAEWHSTKNGNLKPENILPQSSKKVWWQKEYFNEETGEIKILEWQAIVRNRYYGDDCPYLTGHQVCKGFNDLETTHPEVAKLWHPTKNKNLKATEVSFGSNIKVWWLLIFTDSKTNKTFHFEWERMVCKQVKNNTCPYLLNQKIMIGFNDLTTTHPDIAKQWHPTKNNGLTPNNFTSISEKKVWWLLPYDDKKTGKHFDFEWQDTISYRAKNKNCPYLTGHKVYQGFNDLATTHPDIAKQWHPTKNNGLTPNDVVAGSEKKVWWLLPYDDKQTGKHFDFEWKTAINNRIAGKNCPYLTNQKIMIGFNDLATTHPDIAKQWHPTKNNGLTPNNVVAGSNKKVWWLLSYDDPQTGKHFDFEWQASIIARTYKKENCPYLTNQKIMIGFNDLTTTHPDIAKLWHSTKNNGLKPEDITKASKKEFYFKCPYCNKEFKEQIIKMTRNKKYKCQNCKKILYNKGKREQI